MATFKFSRAIDLHWQGYEIVGPAETVFSIPDQLYEEFNDDIAPVEPTLVWIDTNEFATLSAAVSVATLSATSPIVVTASSSGKTISLNANYSTSTHLHDSDYVNVGGDTMSGQLLVSSASTTSTVGFGEIIVAKGTSYGSITVNATDDHLHLRSRNPIEVLEQSGSTMQGLRARGLGVNSSHTYPTLIDDGITFGEDANLYRVSANALKTDDALEVVGTLTNGGTSVSLSTHTHPYQPSGTYVNAVIGTSPASVSTASGTSTVSIVAGSINSTHLSATSVGSSQLIAQAVGTAKISSGAATSGQLLQADGLGAAVFATVASGGGGVSSVAGTSPIVSSGTTAITVSIQSASTSAAGAVQLSDSVSTTSSVLAATPTAVKSAYDLANLAVSKTGLEGYLFSSTVGTAIPNAPHFVFNSGASFGSSGSVLHTRIIPHRNITVSNLAFTSHTTVSAGLTLARFGIYTRSGTTFTLVARTASDTTIFNTSNTKYTRALDTTGGYPATYAMTAGSEYWISYIQVGTTMGGVLYFNLATSASAAAFGSRNYTQSGQTDLPATSTGTVGNSLVFAEVS